MLTLPDLIVVDNVALFHKGWLSQWYPSPFTVDGVRYTCAEQYMMAEKARLFGDHGTRALVLDATNPSEQKRLGRQVQGFDETVWVKYARTVVYRGNLAKFTAHATLRTYLEATDDLVLAEASPTDTIWGIGLAATHPDAGTKSRWRGSNWLGQVLMRVRVELQLDSRLAGFVPPKHKA